MVDSTINGRSNIGRKKIQQQEYNQGEAMRNGFWYSYFMNQLQERVEEEKNNHETRDAVSLQNAETEDSKLILLSK